METSSLEGQPGMEIAGSRILIISPPETYWTGSCIYNVSFEQASIWPDSTGTKKELVAFWYSFTYVEVPPSLEEITRDDTKTTDTSVGSPASSIPHVITCRIQMALSLLLKPLRAKVQHLVGQAG